MEKQPVNAGLVGRRETLRESSDVRAVRTRGQISEALERLTARGAEITVSSIVREAGISRGTFYTHYSGLEGLAVELQAEVVHLLAGLERTQAHLDPEERVRSRRDSIAEALGGVVEHYARYRSFYAAVFSMPVSQANARLRVEALAAELQEHMSIDAVVPEGVNIRLAALFIAGGWTTVITDWVLGNVEATEGDVARHMVMLVPEWLYRLRVNADLEG
ncbi:TetR/AcrR family transcriptional regulator [Corynebacterium sp. YIM 101645]|uniref:TetR/AcrR family transcriptional regulator n=1 Tax=Corynebacterium lemuris TaxID=1859292 RepID=A0ABT2FSD6_9CORY|nr:TetR/AcrR family transcriptional regulator [Corynebacterium lemuris]MCS5478138.1 TetR/AcrR family transcriptional regulator [Corynebacterium lemuris]